MNLAIGLLNWKFCLKKIALLSFLRMYKKQTKPSHTLLQVFISPAFLLKITQKSLCQYA